MTSKHLTRTFVAAGAASWILIGHWFPFRKGWGRDMHRIEAYTYGVLGIVGPALLAYRMAGTKDAAGILVASTLSAGAATVTSKAADAIIEYRHQINDLQEWRNHARTSPTL